jgi:murein DD-endopeptidase MepM/ murein hydrolase activator NlpD
VLTTATLAIPIALSLSVSGQLTGPKLSFVPASPRIGDLALVYIEGIDPEINEGSLRAFGFEFALFRVSKEKLRAAVAIPIDIQAGEHLLTFDLGNRTIKGKIQVANRGWDSSTLKVSREFTKKKSKELLLRLKAEEKALLALWEEEPDPPHFVGSFARPLDGEITGVFGTRRIFNGRLNSVHYGLDLEGKVGEPIRAIQGGKVVMSSMRWASGGTIIIDHGGSIFSAYFHMSRRDRKPGDWVKPGEVIGAVGKTGRVTGPHLHLQFFLRARRIEHGEPGRPKTLQVDPERALDLTFEGEPRYVNNGTQDGASGVGGDDEFGDPDK